MNYKLTRHILLTFLIFSLVLFSACTSRPKATDTTSQQAVDPAPANSAGNAKPAGVKSGSAAKQLLSEGNNRFVTGQFAAKDLSSTRREALKEKGQQPFAIIVSCSDSRVPPELLFDQGLGDLFVVRVAGNVADPVALGSIEYAVEHLGSPLIVVMGHEKCGAVKATVEGKPVPGSIGEIAKIIQPAVDKVKATGVTGADLVEKSADENVRAVITTIEKSPVVKHFTENGRLTVVGAKYHIGTGKVEWLETKTENITPAKQ